MLIRRRQFLIGLSAVICAPAIVRASNLMPVRADDPLIDWIQYQNYPFGTARPETDYISGSFEFIPRRAKLSRYKKRLDELSKPWDHLYWEPHVGASK